MRKRPNQKILKLCLLGYYLLVIGIPINSQSTARLFTRLNITYPDAPAFVSCIMQDQLGFMWIGSTDGLYRFDGYEFKAFRHDSNDSTSLQNNTITALHEDSAVQIVAVQKKL